jgi:hypothetical protein
LLSAEHAGVLVEKVDGELHAATSDRGQWPLIWRHWLFLTLHFVKRIAVSKQAHKHQCCCLNAGKV